VGNEPQKEPYLVPEEWARAIQNARAGRPGMLAKKVSESAIPQEHRKAVAELIANPPKPALRSRRVPEDLCRLIRQVYAGLTNRASSEWLTGEQARAQIANSLIGVGVSTETIRDIVEYKKTYAKDGESTPTTFPTMP
jgi:hypothetical protein